MFSIITIKQIIEQLSAKINTPDDLKPIYGISKNDGTPHIEVDDSSYRYITLERDSRTNYRETKDLDELLYWVFNDITFQMAGSFELANRVLKADSRKLRFSYQLDLLEKLNPLWKELRKQEIEKILKASPYQNNVGT